MTKKIIKEIKLSKRNGILCENLYGELRYITQNKFDDIIDLYNRVEPQMDNKNWLKFRDVFYLNEVLHNGGFIIGCYIDDILVASALCEEPSDSYTECLHEIGMTLEDIKNTYASGYVMVDPMYRGNSLHRVLLESRIDVSIEKDKKFIITAVAVENVYSLRTVLNLGFEIKMQQQNELGTLRNILVKELISDSAITA